MSDDYLWDRSGPPDPDVERLEALLAPLRSTPPIPAIPSQKVAQDVLTAEASAKAVSSAEHRAAWTLRSVAPMLAAAAAIVLMIASTWQSTRGAGSFQVARVDGQPQIGSAALAGTGRIAVGQTLVTDDASRARVDVSTIGEVILDPGSRMRLIATRDGHHQLALDRGTLHAKITAPPGQFIVDTPAARATDLGCAYTLHVDEDGTSVISVTAGWVAFDRDGLESFVPAGASARTRPGRGPGTPKYDTESQEYRDAVDDFDEGDPARRHEALERILKYGGHGDVVTLWHLIPRVDASDRASVVDALADQIAMPDGVSRDAALRADKAALDRWWDALGLGDTAWWRTWRRPLN